MARRRGTVLAAATVGAVAGPNLLGPAGDVTQRLGLPEPAGLFLIAIPAFLAAAAVLAAFLRPDPLQAARTSQHAAGGEQPVPAGPKGTLAAVLLLATGGYGSLGLAALAPCVLLLAMLATATIGYERGDMGSQLVDDLGPDRRTPAGRAGDHHA